MPETMTVTTDRLVLHLATRGEGAPVLFLHGNVSDGEVWYEQMELLPRGYRGIAVDLRGFGRSEHRPVDATRGVRDFSDDVRALVEVLGLGPVHLVGHSMGAAVALQYALDAGERVRSLTLVAPVSPYGYGGTKADGSPCAPDFAGSGGGAANPDFVQRLAAGDRSADAPTSPRSTIRAFFFPSPEVIRDEEAILDSMLRTAVGEDNYPGDIAASDHWPNVAPGTRGVLNAVSPKYLDLAGFASSGLRVPVLWVHGAQDMVIGDAALLDLGQLGALGAVPGWPGAETFPPQPMVAQTRAVLDAYAAAGGAVREESFEEAGHFLFTQLPERFAAALRAHLEGAVTRD